MVRGPSPNASRSESRVKEAGTFPDANTSGFFVPPSTAPGCLSRQEEGAIVRKSSNCLLGGIMLIGLGCAHHPGLGVKDSAGRSYLIKERIPVSVHVDFGPAGKAPVDESVLVTLGSTPRDAVSVLMPVKSGMVCCDTREVAEIGGVLMDPIQGRWWVVSVNGQSNVSPYQTQLKRDDHVERRFISRGGAQQ